MSCPSAQRLLSKKGGYSQRAEFTYRLKLESRLQSLNSVILGGYLISLCLLWCSSQIQVINISRVGKT